MSINDAMAVAKFWVDTQRLAFGSPPITDVEASLCEDNRFVMVYCDIGRDLPVAAAFDLGRQITACEFAAMRDGIEEEFRCLDSETRQ